MSLKSLFFDMDRTLCDTVKANNIAVNALSHFFEEKFPGTSHAYSAAEGYLDAYYGRIKNHWLADIEPIIDPKAQRIKMLELIIQERFGISNSSYDECQYIENYFEEIRIGGFDFFSGVEELLLRLRENFTIVVITNGAASAQCPKVERVNLRDFVDYVIVGGEFSGPEKPSLEIFQHACKLASCQNTETLHVGDSLYADISGANKNSITSVWVKQPETEIEGIQPDYIIDHILEIEELILKLEV